MSIVSVDAGPAVRDLAIEWAAACSHFDEALVHTQSAARVSVLTRGHQRRGLHIEYQQGVSVLVRMGRRWLHQHAPVETPARLADWLSELSGRPVTVPDGAPPPPDEWIKEAVSRITPSDAWWRAVPHDTDLTVQEDFEIRHVASADAHGVATEHTTGGTRRRCTVVHRVEHGYVGKRRHYRSGLKAFEERTAMELAARALTQAVQIAAAAPVTRRTTPVVFAPAVGAAFFHELVGHAAEADNLAAPDSYLARLLDRRVTDSGLVVIDDPALEDGFGSMAVDDEGAPAQPVRLIDRGVVSGSLNSLRTRGGGARNGHGRRASFRAPALPRATNLVIGPGPAGPADLTAPGAGELLLISALGAGGVHPHSGEFLFTASEAYLITKQGRRPLRDVHLTGMATDALARLTAIGSDGATDSAACLKRGQAIGVGFSSPSIRFDELTWWS